VISRTPPAVHVEEGARIACDRRRILAALFDRSVRIKHDSQQHVEQEIEHDQVEAPKIENRE
jgi:hypothetical protein